MLKSWLRASLFPFLFFPFYFLVKGLTAYFRLTGWRRKRQNRKKRVLFLASFFPGNAGYYWRAKKWSDILNTRAYETEIYHVFNRETFYRLRKQNSVLRFQLYSMAIRLRHILYSRHFDLVVVRRTLLIYNEYGNLFYEKLLLAIHPDAILDFDDDMLIREDPPRQMTIYGRLMFENHHKFYDSLRLYRHFIVGSAYLKELVLRENKGLSRENILMMPTCVDYESSQCKEYLPSAGTPVHFGWIGGSGNLFYLDRLIPVLNCLCGIYPLELLVISGRAYNPAEARFPIKNLNWSLEKEIELLRKIDLGLMPLDDNELSRGKCGFKLVQYGSLGIVAVATGLPANREIIEDNKTGFLVNKEDAWYDVLKRAVEMHEKWPEMGQEARKRMERYYMFEKNTPKYISFMNQVSLN